MGEVHKDAVETTMRRGQEPRPAGRGERDIADALKAADEIMMRLNNGCGYSDIFDASYEGAALDEYRDLRSRARAWLSDHGAAVLLARQRP